MLSTATQFSWNHFVFGLVVKYGDVCGSKVCNVAHEPWFSLTECGHKSLAIKVVLEVLFLLGVLFTN